MIPETVGALFAFLALVAPGVSFEILREKRRPSIEETSFREASRVALTSLVFTIGAVGVLALVRTVNPRVVLDPGAWLTNGSAYVSDNLGLVCGTLVVEIAFALILVAIVDVLFRRSATGHIVPGSAWFLLFRQRRPAGATPWLHIKLDDGTEIWGFVGDYSADQRLENRELSIFGPRLQYRRKDATANEFLDAWSSISVRGDAIVWMKVAYVADDSPAETPRLMPAVQPKTRRKLSFFDSAERSSTDAAH